MHDDFDLQGLANYLHLDLNKVKKLVERGDIPSRRIGGDWRFSPADIHHWLEERIGISGEKELLQVEAAMERSDASAETIANAAGLIPHGGIAYPLAARTRNSAIRSMCQLAMETGLLWDVDKMIAAVEQRENLHSTALDNGVALLPPRRPMAAILAEPFMVLGRTHQGIPFGGQGGLTDIFFLLCNTTDAEHLRTLARVSRLVSADSFLEEIRSADDADAIREVIVRFEDELPL